LASESWIVENIQNAFNVWNTKMAEIWTLVAQSPAEFKGGAIWSVIRGISNALTATGLALVVLFFAMGVMKSTIDFSQLKRPEQALKFFLRFVLAKTAVTYGLEIITAIFEICQGVIAKAMSAMGGIGVNKVAIPDAIVKKIEAVGFFESIPLWAVTLLGSLFITVLSFVMILSIYGRFFKLYTYAALAPVPLSTFAGEGTSSVGVHFLKSFAGVCLEGAVVVIACLIYSAFVSSSPVQLRDNMTAVNMVWCYVGETIFGMLVLVGSIKASDRVIKELMGL